MSLEKSVSTNFGVFFRQKHRHVYKSLTLYINLYHLIQVMAGRALGFFSQVYGLQPSGMTATLLGQPLDTIKTLMQSLGWTFSVFGDDSREGVIDDLFSTKFLGSDGKVEQLVV